MLIVPYCVARSLFHRIIERFRFHISELLRGMNYWQAKTRKQSPSSVLSLHQVESQFSPWNLKPDKKQKKRKKNIEVGSGHSPFDFFRFFCFFTGFWQFSLWFVCFYRITGSGGGNLGRPLGISKNNKKNTDIQTTPHTSQVLWECIVFCGFLNFPLFLRTP